MKRFPVALACAAIGLAFVAGALHTISAETVGGGQPDDSVRCYYNLWTCSYADGTAYWSGCQPGYPQGYILTGTAKVICTTYHPS